MFKGGKENIAGLNGRGRGLQRPRTSVLRLTKSSAASLQQFRKLNLNIEQDENAKSARQIPQRAAPGSTRRPRTRQLQTNCNIQNMQENTNMMDISMESNDSTTSSYKKPKRTQTRSQTRTKRKQPQKRLANSLNNSKKKSNMNNRSNNRSRNKNDARNRRSNYVRSMKKPMTITQAKDRIKQLKRERDEIENDRNALEEELNEINDTISNTTRGHLQEVSNLQTNISQLQNQKMQLESKHQLLQQQITNLQSENQLKNNQIQMAQAASNATKQQIATLQQTIQMKDSMLSNNKNEIEMLQSQNKMHLQTSQHQMQQITNLNMELSNLKNELNKLKQELQNEKSEKMSLELKNAALNQTCERQRIQINDLTNNKQSLERTLEMTNNSISQMRIEMSAIQNTNMSLENTCKNQANTIQQQAQTIEQAKQCIAQHEQRAIKDEEVRKRMHNQIQELKGNIRVYCRVRPLLPNHITNQISSSSFRFNDADIECQEVILQTQSTVNRMGQNVDGRVYKFQFDRVFRPHAQQNNVFTEISQLVQSALDGYKVCIFAYGQTGSGKTYTMEGRTTDPNDDCRGMIPRAVEKIFEHGTSLALKGWRFQCKATYLEIYNEKIRDLLVQQSSNSQISYLDLHQRKTMQQKNKFEVYVDGLTEHVVSCSQDVFPLLKRAKKNRSVSQTDCNAQSSRSHSVFQLFLDGINAATNQRTCGVLNLIDLAGSERLKKSGSQGDQMKEAININQSLSCLGDVISALSKKNSKHIPYRNSKLTHLLMNYFGNQAKTLMFVNLCPEMERSDESLCSLRFAAKVNDCQIGTAKRTVK